MKKVLTYIFIFSIAGNIFSQDTDIGVPAASPFHLGGDIQGTIENSINESTGKVTFSAALASISANSVSYSVGLTYNGQASFKNGQQTNKYNSTSIVGVGWSMGTPKIVVDNKGTGARDDDDFYFQDGATNSKLICYNRGTTSNGSQWEFQLEKYAPWKIYFYHHNGWGDYWKVIKEDGLTYYFGNSSTKDGKEFEVRYGNWIGSSKQFGATSEQTIVWNITKIEDQWLNSLTFTYNTVKQLISGKDQTEAAFLAKVTSSNGGSIQLIYGDKAFYEYYEPHKESAEPDAYQERYEKKYLQKVLSYNNANQLVSTYNLGHTLNGTGLNTKRYLTSLTQTVHNNGVSETLPSQIFEYHLTGTFKGGLRKVSYPSGGSVTYNYINKKLFQNSVNLFESPLVWPTGYEYHSVMVRDNYSLYIMRSIDPVSGGKHRLKFFRFWWNGSSWEHDEFTFPHLIADGLYSAALTDLHLIFEDDFYGLAYDKGTTADIYLFHLKNDGRTWHSYTSTYKNIGSENPQLVSGNGFVGLQNHRGGELYTYVWNGTSWNYKMINQGSGQYYIAATNNYIISLNEDGGTDLGNGLIYMDNYYFHFLDAEKNWQTKSWTEFAYSRIAQISQASYWYPDNSIIGFMADNNPELFFRWDTNYNLSNIDNVMGGYNDNEPMQPIANSLFTIRDDINQRPYKSARFNGINWKVDAVAAPAGFASLNFSSDFMAYKHDDNNIKYHSYDPNTNSWSNNYLNPNTLYISNPIGINSEFYAAGKKFYQKSNTGIISEIGSFLDEIYMTISDGREKIYRSDTWHRPSLYYIDKMNGQLNYSGGFSGSYFTNRAYLKLGRYSFFSPKTIWLRRHHNSTLPFTTYLHRIIDDDVSAAVNDVVVNHLDINDENGSLRKIQYTYNKFRSLPDNSSTYYGEVIIENKGEGTGNIGKTVKIFNDGGADLSMVGLPLEVLILDANNNIKKRITTTWNKYSKSAYNGSAYFYNSYYIRPTLEKEELFFENSSKIVTTTTNSYNTLGLKTYSTTTDSKGKTVREDITYAYQQYNFLNDKNMISFPYQKTTKINNQIMNVEQSKWVNLNGKAYINENWSGPSSGTLRLNSQVSTVLSSGAVVESNNGKGEYNSALYGYNNMYEVAIIKNVTFQEVSNALDVSYATLQNLTTSNLKTELLKLYTKLPNAFINLSFYDADGRIISQINERREESFIYYDVFGRKDYVTDAQGNILEKKNYHFRN